MQAQELEGRHLVDSEGHAVGAIQTVYVNDATQRPEWATVHTGMFGSKHSFVPLTSAIPHGDGLRVPFAKDQIAAAPRVEDDGSLDADEEARLAQHYGLGYGGAQAPPAAPPSVDDAAMTLSEEEMRVGVIRRPSELVRLRKTVVTEPVSQTVPLRREELHLEREQIDPAEALTAGSDHEISESLHEVVLSQEEPVVETRTVPVERVHVEKDVVTEEREVTGEVRREHVEVEREPQR